MTGDDMTAPQMESPRLGEPYLLTPGPLTTSFATKEAMLKDWGSRDGGFRAMTRDLRSRLLGLIGHGSDSYDCVPIQGSGTYCVEAMLGSLVPKEGKVLVLANGAYGLRGSATLDYLGRAKVLLDKGDYLPPRGEEIAAILANDPRHHPCVRHSLRNLVRHLEPDRRDRRGHTCRGPQAADRQHVRVWRTPPAPGRAGMRGICLLRQQVLRGRARFWICHCAQGRDRGGQGQLAFAVT